MPTEAEVALGRSGIDALEATGLAEVGDDVIPRARLLPIGKLLLASDGFSRDADDPADYVATYTPTARVLDSLTPRPRVERALDVGTGSGIHALLAAQHAGQVIATDVNPRALAYTTLNAALNGLHNVECRQGSLFEPVEGETFGLITCNAPYVISPETRWVYRDSEFSEDGVSERVLLSAAAHLADDGYAAMLVSWLAFDENAPDERVIGWAEASGCDSWILSTLNSDPLTHAAEWNSHLAGEALGDALDEWARYFDDLGVELVSEGGVILHKRPGGGHSARVDELDEEDLDDAGDQILRAFEGRARLAELRSDEALLEERIGVASSLRLERELERAGSRAVDVEGSVDIAEGTKHAVDASADAQEVIASLDSRLRLAERRRHDRRPAGIRRRRDRGIARGDNRSHPRAARARRAALPRRLTAADQRQRLESVSLRAEIIDLEVTMKGASKPKKLAKKVPQKSLKEKRQDKRAAGKKGLGST